LKVVKPSFTVVGRGLVQPSQNVLGYNNNNNNDHDHDGERVIVVLIEAYDSF